MIMCQCQWMQIQCKVRQGCPLAFYLFILVGEMLNVMVKQIVDSKDIARVFLLKKEKHLISQSIDDMSLIIKIEEKIVNNMVNILHDFETTLILEINDRKNFTYY